MSVGAGGPKIPWQTVDVDRVADAPPVKPLTRWILYGALAVLTVVVVGGLAWLFLAD